MDSGHPDYDKLVAEMEAAATKLAQSLANHLNIRMTHPGAWEGEAFGGLCANFGPSTPGQLCPEVIDNGDPGGDWATVGDYYFDHKCPDCGEYIALDTEFGDGCGNCGHVFNMPAPNDGKEQSV